MQGSSGDLEELERTLGDRSPDIMVVLEPPADWVTKVTSGTVGFRVHANPGSHLPRVLALAATKVTSVSFPDGHHLPGSSLAFDVVLDGLLIRVLAVHVQAPTRPGRRNVRDAELRAVGDWARRHSGPEIVLGDLNATPWSSSIERLEDEADPRNSADGFGVQPTWPALAGPVGIPIDHLVHSRDLTVTDRVTGPSFGSAHRSLWVTIARAAPG